MKFALLILVFIFCITYTKQDTEDYSDLPYAIVGRITDASTNIVDFFNYNIKRASAWFNGCNSDFVNNMNIFKSNITTELDQFFQDIEISADIEYSKYLDGQLRYSSTVLIYNDVSEVCREIIISFFNDGSLRNSYLNCMASFTNDATLKFSNFFDVLNYARANCNSNPNINIQVDNFVQWLNGASLSVNNCVNNAILVYDIATTVIQTFLQYDCSPPL